MRSMDLFDEIKTLTKKLVAIPSMNATSGERDIADAIEAYLRDIPYFKAHPELVITQDLKEDPLHRRNVMALLKGGDGTERDTIMLHGHIDTVDVDDFGRYKPYAFDCDKLAEVFRDAELPEDARRDLESGDYLFGRGACDMKGGDAVFLVLAKHLAEQAEKLHGNLLLSFNPVEETLHRGIIEELPLLRKLQEQHNLTFRLAINNDFICPMYAGDTTRYVYGLPLSAVVGKAEIMDKWTAGAHGGTFGANPVSCAAALAAIDALEGGAIENGRRMGEYFIGELKKLQAKYPVIGDVRGLGLMIGMEMVYPDGSPNREMTARIVSLALEHDLYLLSCGCDKNVVRFIAPLTVSKEEIDTALSVLGKVFDQIADEA